MKLKKIFALFIAIVMLCTAVVSVGAARQEHVIYDVAQNEKAATAIYTLDYYSGMNCVRAMNAIQYEKKVNVAQRNFPGYILLDVSMNVGYWLDWKADYLTTSSYYAFFFDDYYIPAGRTFTEATAYLDTNLEVSPDEFDGQYYYENSNYTDASTSTNLIIP